MASTVNRVVSNTIYLYLKMGITMVLSLLTTRIVLKALGTTDFGIYNIVGGIIVMLGFLNSTMASATQRFMNYAEGEQNKEKQISIFNVSYYLHLLVAVLSVIVLVVAFFIFFNGIIDVPNERLTAAKIVYFCMVASTMINIITVPYDAAINAHEDLKYFSLVGVIDATLRLLIGIAIIFATFDKLVVYAFLIALTPLMVLLLKYIYCKRKYSECVLYSVGKLDRGVFKEMTGFAGWNLLGSSSSLIGNYGLGVVLNHFFGVLLNAAQGIATQVNGMLLVFSTNMMKALSPVIAKNEGAGDHEKMLTASLMGNKFSALLFSFFAIPAIIEMQYLLELWLGEVPKYAVVFTQLLLVRTFFDQLSAVFHLSIAAVGDIAGYNKVVVWFDIVPLIIIYFLFKLGYPPVTMYIVAIIAYGIGKTLVKVYFVHSKCGLPYMTFLKKEVFPLLLVTIPVSLICICISIMLGNGLFRLSITILTSSICFLFFSWLFAIEKNEKRMILELVKPFISRIQKRL